MSFGLRIIEDVSYQYWGLDLGQSRDYTALAMVERAELFLDEVDPVTYERKMRRRFRVRYLRRVPLGTAYPDVVTREIGRAHV